MGKIGEVMIDIRNVVGDCRCNSCSSLAYCYKTQFCNDAYDHNGCRGCADICQDCLNKMSKEIDKYVIEQKKYRKI